MVMPNGNIKNNTKVTRYQRNVSKIINDQEGEIELLKKELARVKRENICLKTDNEAMLKRFASARNRFEFDQKMKEKYSNTINKFVETLMPEKFANNVSNKQGMILGMSRGANTPFNKMSVEDPDILEKISKFRDDINDAYATAGMDRSIPLKEVVSRLMENLSKGKEDLEEIADDKRKMSIHHNSIVSQNETIISDIRQRLRFSKLTVKLLKGKAYDYSTLASEYSALKNEFIQFKFDATNTKNNLQKMLDDSNCKIQFLMRRLDEHTNKQLVGTEERTVKERSSGFRIIDGSRARIVVGRSTEQPFVAAHTRSFVIERESEQEVLIKAEGDVTQSPVLSLKLDNHDCPPEKRVKMRNVLACMNGVDRKDGFDWTRNI